jgi:3-hydroxybutyryl-CoA dehydrogenase
MVGPYFNVNVDGDEPGEAKVRMAMMVTSEPTAIGVVGGGTMGVGIAYVFALAGFEVSVVEPDAARQRALRQTIAETAAAGVARGKLTSDEAGALKTRVRVLASTVQLPTAAALVIETVSERLEIKQQVIAQIDARRPQLVATNTSALSIDVLADSMREPANFLGMHFFNPVWFLPMIELVRGARTSEAALARAREFAAAIGKQTITVKDSPGFATSRLDLIASLEAMRMLEAGVASAEDIDRAMVIAYRHPIGPLRLSDVVGLDVRLDIARNLALPLGERYAPPHILIEKVARGELGKKSGRGFFDWI